MISLSPAVAVVLRGRRRSVFVVPSITAIWPPLLLVASVVGLVHWWLPFWAIPIALLCGPLAFTRLVAFSRGKWSVWLALGPIPFWRLSVATHQPTFIGIELHDPEEDDLDIVPHFFHRCVVERGSSSDLPCFRPEHEHSRTRSTPSPAGSPRSPRRGRCRGAEMIGRTSEGGGQHPTCSSQG